uniref:Uncharacterized protein n=1 Tax=Octopus bimaculoides TaxID=37653 RepID=A0A0L8GN80_OCTBM
MHIDTQTNEDTPMWSSDLLQIGDSFSSIIHCPKKGTTYPKTNRIFKTAICLIIGLLNQG